MLRVGLTGGLATGKSFVGRTLAGFGCHLIRNDDLGHAVMQPGGEAYDGIVREFGPAILNPDGTVDRRKLAAQVFDNPDRLAALNALVHPPVRARTHQELDAFERSHPDGIAVVEAAILVETGSFREYEKLIVAVCGEEQQIERAMSRDGLTREEVVNRLSRQMPLAEKIRYADYVIDTSGTKENTIAQTKAVYESLVGSKSGLHKKS
ncbi:MAG TPA: dephospho-CoA kinase [Bryobacteraceae bacterium]|nr:dephospho-CoA kinase [Bryobacteraceae bacterium]